MHVRSRLSPYDHAVSGGPRASGAARTPAWRAHYTTEELAPTDAPCLLLVRIGDGVHALVAGADKMPLLPARGQDSGSAREALTEEGHVVFLEGEALRDDPELPYLERRYSTGIFRLDLRTHTTTRMPFEPRPGQRAYRRLAASHDGQRLLIAEGWSLPIEIPPDATPGEQAILQHNALRTTLTVIDVTQGRSRELHGIAGTLVGPGGDDTSIQWSPGGDLIALTTFGRLVAGELAPRPAVCVLDAASGLLVDLVPNAQLIGSLAWSSDSTQFLIARNGRVVVHHAITGEDSTLPAFPGCRPEPPGHGQHRVLGFADEQQVFTATESGKSMTVWLTDTRTGDARPLCQCAGHKCQYPNMSAAPLNR